MQITGTTGANASLLDYINSQEDSSKKTGKKDSGISDLLQQSCVASNPVLTQISNQASKSGIYKNTVTNASSVLKYLDTLMDSGEDSVFSQAEKEQNTDTLVTKIGSMAVSYNKLLANLAEEGGKTSSVYTKSLVTVVESAGGQLEKIGITVEKDGSLSADLEKLCEADLSDLKALFGNGSEFGKTLTETVGEVNEASSQSARLAMIYSTAYSNSGSYSQYEFIKNMYDSLA